MDHFAYRDRTLFCEDVPVPELAEQYGTPLYVYSEATLLRHLREVQTAFAEAKPIIAYSVKSNGNLSICRLMAEHGSGFDVTSGGELHRALTAGGTGTKIVYAGVGNDETSGIDYYNCLNDQADDCEEYSEGLIRTRAGNRKLDPETSKSWTAGFVWSPLDGLDLSLDWFDIDMRNQVQDMSVDSILRDEASCRLGDLDINSPTCVDALARITRSSNGSLYGIYVNPINVARETTSGADLSARYRFDTSVGRFTLSANHTWVKRHDFQQYKGDRVEDEFEVNSGFDIPRTKTSASVTWEKDAWSATLHGERLGRLPNGWSYDQVWEDGDPGPTIAPTYRFNASAQYTFGDHARLSLAVTNLFNKMPPHDPTYTAYPYYDISWFDAVGRTVYVQYTHKFGGSPL